MKLLVQTTSLDDVRWAAAAGLLDGVHTTPLALADAADDVRERVIALAQVSGVPVHVAVHTLSGAEAYREARDIARLHDQFVVHLPLVEDLIGAMHRLRADGVRVAAAMVFTPAQAIIASRAGASAVVMPLAAAAAAGLRVADVLRDIRAALDAARAECDLIAEGPATPVELAAAVTAGADAVAAPVTLLRDALLHPSTDRCVDAFLHDVARQPRPWGAE